MKLVKALQMESVESLRRSLEWIPTRSRECQANNCIYGFMEWMQQTSAFAWVRDDDYNPANRLVEFSIQSRCVVYDNFELQVKWWIPENFLPSSDHLNCMYLSRDNYDFEECWFRICLVITYPYTLSPHEFLLLIISNIVPSRISVERMYDCNGSNRQLNWFGLI